MLQVLYLQSLNRRFRSLGQPGQFFVDSLYDVPNHLKNPTQEHVHLLLWTNNLETKSSHPIGLT